MVGLQLRDGYSFMTSVILGFHHIAVIVSDYQKSKRFYTQILGAEIITETYRASRDSYKLDLRFSAAAVTLNFSRSMRIATFSI